LLCKVLYGDSASKLFLYVQVTLTIFIFETMLSNVGRKLSLEMRRSSPPRDDKAFSH
jgi:hypothetical protein